jgi:transposase
MILLTEFQEITRFRSLDELASYVGLIPDTHSSGETEHTGDLTKRRHAQLRASLVEAAWVAVRKDPALMMAFQESCQRMRKTRAIVKIARKLLNRVRFVLKNQTPYRLGVVS